VRVGQLLLLLIYGYGVAQPSSAVVRLASLACGLGVIVFLRPDRRVRPLVRLSAEAIEIATVGFPNRRIPYDDVAVTSVAFAESGYQVLLKRSDEKVLGRVNLEKREHADFVARRIAHASPSWRTPDGLSVEGSNR
jgi:hypothetical protein